MRKDFCIFILSYQRPNNVITLDSILRAGYSGDWYIILGNDDKTIDEYINKYGKDRIIIFDKDKEMNLCDTCDIFNKKKVILYARNYCFKIAEDFGYKYFLELDDDYTNFRYRYEYDGKFISMNIREFDKIVDIMIDFLDESNALSVAFGQSGDFIGGKDSLLARKKIKRKAMNSFFCRTDRKFEFIGTINEDVNTYCMLGSMGYLFMTISNICLDQKKTQSQSGGMTDEYIDNGTYLKSFYTVMTNPSFVKICMMPSSIGRIHHIVDWNCGVPKILSYKYKK